MKFIVNKEKQSLSFPFNGNTYTFAVTDECYKVEDDLYEHLREIVPLAFDFDIKPGKNVAVIEPSIVDTKNKFGGGQFGQKSREMGSEPDVMEPDQLTGDGWYGDGLQDDTP
jgi:hypothetical protein